MSAASNLKLTACGCCEGAVALSDHQNRPGLSAIVYRIGTHATFLRDLLARIHAQSTPDNPAARPLAGLTTRSSDDPSIAVLDAWAVLADVLTFYQERIANEGFLRTATERRSILEMARAIGYELRPGVAANTYLAFTVDDAQGAPAQVAVPAGTKVQSVPPQGKLPQTFESSQALTAKVGWNKILPRLTRPQDLVLRAGDNTLYLAGISTSFPAGTPGLQTFALSDLFLLNPETQPPPSVTQVQALPVNQIYLKGTNLNLKRGDRLLLVAKGTVAAAPQTKTLIVRDVVEEPKLNRTGIDVRVDLGQPVAIPPFQRAVLTAGAIGSSEVLLNQSNVDTVLQGAFTGAQFNAVLAIAGWAIDQFILVANNPPQLLPPPDEGVFAMRSRAGVFGNNAPRHDSLLKADGSFIYPKDWDSAWPIWKDSITGDFYNTDADVYLERSFPGILKDSWIIFEHPGGPPTVFRVNNSVERSLAGFGLSGKSTGLQLATPDGVGLLDSDKDLKLTIRNTSALVDSEQLQLAELPVTDDITAGSTELVLDSLVDLQPGQLVAITGNQADASALVVSEVMTLADVIQAERNSTLVFTAGLAYSYIRNTVTINANVVQATHGETIPKEALGSGDGSQSNQTFKLSRPPLTYLSAATPGGVKSTLSVRVNDILWAEEPSLYGLGPRDETYIVRLEDDGATEVIFGDGKSGARLPTGKNNITAAYRSGIGPDGNVPSGTLTLLQTKPLGIREVTNPVAAAGGDGPQKLADARVNAPLTVLTLDRIVSLEDYENFARAFAGIAKAQAVSLWSGETQLVHLTVAAPGGLQVDSVTMQSLVDAVVASHDPPQGFQIANFQKLLFNLTAGVLVDPRYNAPDVLAAVSVALNDAFSFENREFAQPATAAEVVTIIQKTPGVIASTVSQLYLVTDPAGPSQVEPATFLPAATAANSTTGFLPAQLLLLNAPGVTLTEIQA